jgi:hypothetical protein
MSIRTGAASEGTVLLQTQSGHYRSAYDDTGAYDVGAAQA